MDFSLGDFSIVDTLGSEFPSDAVDSMGSNLSDVTPVFSYSGIDPSLSDYANSEFLSPDLQGSSTSSFLSNLTGAGAGDNLLSSAGGLMSGLMSIFKKPSVANRKAPISPSFSLLMVLAVVIGIFALVRLK